MRIAVDAMGGDYAPEEIVKGAVDAARTYGVGILLVGQRDEIRMHLDGVPLDGLDVSIVEASQVIEMHEHPAMAVKNKPDSSLIVGMQLVKRGEAVALVSAGNSGAAMAASMFILGRIDGIDRPAIGALAPSINGPVFLIDAGANADCKPAFLQQFAMMGSLYMEKVFGVNSPRVGLLSNGEEETKGNQLVQQAHALIKSTGLNFVGNVEGKDIHKGVADVVVCDGFTGNVVVKLIEGVSEMLVDLVKQAIISKPHFWAASLVLKPAFDDLAKRMDYAEYGGAPLLGVNGLVIIGHGRSNAKAIKNSIRVAKNEAEGGLLEAFKANKIAPINDVTLPS